MAKKKVEPTNYLVPNMDAYQVEIERIHKQQAERAAKRKGQRGKIFFYQWKDGDNNLLFLPPWNVETREVFKRVWQMYKLPPDSETHMCIEKSAPELNLKCPILAVIREANTAGHNVKRQWPVNKNYWQVLDLDGVIREVEIEEDSKKIKKQINFRYQPQVISLSPTVHDELFSYFYNPDVGAFTDPNNAVPMELNRKVGNNNIPVYSAKPITNFVGGKKIIIRMPIAETPEAIAAIIGTVEGKELKGGSLYDLDGIYRLPVEALKPEGGAIYKTAMKLRAYYNLDQVQGQVQGQVQTPVQINPAYIPPAPGLQGIPVAPVVPLVPIAPTANPAYIPPVVQTPVIPVQVVQPAQVVQPVQPVIPPVTPTPEYKNPKDMNIPEDQIIGGQAKKPVTFPGAPNCFGTFAATSQLKAEMQNGQYSNGVLLENPAATAVVCDMCPYKAVCQGVTQ